VLKSIVDVGEGISVGVREGVAVLGIAAIVWATSVSTGTKVNGLGKHADKASSINKTSNLLMVHSPNIAKHPKSCSSLSGANIMP
jgi:hypothetical protein